MSFFPCPCCHELVYQTPADGDYSICPVCGWEDDPVQSANPDFAGGANALSMNQARDLWLKKRPLGGPS